MVRLAMSVVLAVGVACAAGSDSGQWWRGFGDPLLDRLMERAGRANLDVRKAESRLAEARAAGKGSRSALLPEVGNSTAVSKVRGGLSQGLPPFETSIVSSGFNLRWEADVFGGLRKTRDAATGEARAAEENVRDVQVIMRAETARNYVELRAAEEQMGIVKATIASEADLLDLIRSRAEAGLASELDVERQAAQLALVRAALPDLDAQRLQAIHRIGVLLGEPPTALVDELEKAHGELRVPAMPGALPGEVLRQRPDVRRAEAQIAAAYARVGAARADLYPKFVITGLSGRASSDFQGLTVGAGNFFSIGPGISLPILNFGRIRSQIKVREAQVEQAERSYEQDLLAAFEEAENALIARDRAEQRRRELETGLTAAKRSVEMSRELYVRGLGDFLTVLDAQREQFSIERDFAASQAAVLRSTVALYKALGG
jgi:NodT family efflux transporter outer membrane factor (OMF) lipoprotein